MRLPGPRLMRVFAMELFTKLFGALLLFVSHCLARIVIHGYLSGLSRPEQVVHFFRNVVGIPVLSKEILSQRTADYQNWVEAFARKCHPANRILPQLHLQTELSHPQTVRTRLRARTVAADSPQDIL